MITKDISTFEPKKNILIKGAAIAQFKKYRCCHSEKSNGSNYWTFRFRKIIV